MYIRKQLKCNFHFTTAIWQDYCNDIWCLRRAHCSLQKVIITQQTTWWYFFSTVQFHFGRLLSRDFSNICNTISFPQAVSHFVHSYSVQWCYYSSSYLSCPASISYSYIRSSLLSGSMPRTMLSLNSTRSKLSIHATSRVVRDSPDSCGPIKVSKYRLTCAEKKPIYSQDDRIFFLAFILPISSFVLRLYPWFFI